MILADEPTAPLDSERALAVMRILNQMARQAQTAIIVVTHDEKIIPTLSGFITSATARRLRNPARDEASKNDFYLSREGPINNGAAPFGRCAS